MKIRVLLLVLLISLQSCDNGGGNDPTPLTPVPLGSSLDELYEIYRKGFIGRHLTSNGRVLQTIGLESVEEGTGPRDESPAKEYWADYNGRIQIKTSAGHTYSFHPDNVRYSYEETPNSYNSLDPNSPGVIPYLWVPMLGPMKEQGLSNSGYYVVTGDGDNPNYYGGMALAMFALEHHYGVSDHAIKYARKLIDYFADEEMDWKKGYIIRTPHFFPGQHKIRGASSEELMGIMLGIMFYLKYEEDKNDPHYSMAQTLAKNILTAVARDWTTINPFKSKYYWHPFMSDTGHDDAYYLVKHFEYPLNRAVGGTLGGRELWLTTMTDTFGSNSLCVWNSSKFFDNVVMFSISTILVLEGNVVYHRKVETAEIFMRDVIKAIVDGALWTCDSAKWIRYNALLGTMARLTSKYLDTNRIKNIWGDNYNKYLDIMKWADTSGFPTSGASQYIGYYPLPTIWQHNLPLDDPEGRNGSLNHNPRKAIGGNFAWIMRNKNDTPLNEYNVWKSSVDYKQALPGWGQGITGSVNDFVQSNSKYYTENTFPSHELCSQRGHCNTQIEGAGLGLLFLRMLLTHIDSSRYPAPKLSDDRWIEPLEHHGAHPLSPDYLKAKAHDNSQNVEGDTNYIISASGFGGREFVTASQGENAKLNMHLWKLTDGSNIQHLGSATGDCIDRVVSKSTVVEDRSTGISSSVVITAERAQNNRFTGPYWLRLSLWQPSFSTGTIGRVREWNFPNTDWNAVKSLDLDAAVVGRKVFPVVLVKGNKNINRLFVFSLTREHGFSQLTSGIDVLEGRGTNGKEVHLTTIGNVIVYSVYDAARSEYRLYSRKWTGIGLSGPMGTTYGDFIHGDGELLDIKALSAKGGGRYVIAAYKNEDDALELHAWRITPEGRLVDRRSINTVEDNMFIYRVPPEMDYKHAKIVSLSRVSGYEPLMKDSAFAVVGHGVAIVNNKDNNIKKSDRGLKVLLGRVLPNGYPTIESFNLAGGHKMSSALDGVGPLCYTKCGLVSVHKAGDNRLNLLHWEYTDPFKSTRWNSDGEYQNYEYPSIETPAFDVSVHVRLSPTYPGNQVVVTGTVKNTGIIDSHNTKIKLAVAPWMVFPGGTSTELNIGVLSPDATAQFRWVIGYPACRTPRSRNIKVSVTGASPNGTVFRTDTGEGSFWCENGNL